MKMESTEPTRKMLSFQLLDQAGRLYEKPNQWAMKMESTEPTRKMLSYQ